MKTTRNSLVLSLLFITIHVNAVQKLIHLERLEMCESSKDSPFLVNAVKVVNRARENVRLFGNFTIKRDLRANPRVVAIVTRCANKEALDTCIPFTTMRVINSCSLIAMQNMAWTDTVSAITPPFRCPIKKGNYILTNGTLDPSLFNFFPIDNYYWTEKLIFRELAEYTTLCINLKIYNVNNL